MDASNTSRSRRCLGESEFDCRYSGEPVILRYLIWALTASCALVILSSYGYAMCVTAIAWPRGP
jgi:hypothetical protein